MNSEKEFLLLSKLAAVGKEMRTKQKLYFASVINKAKTTEQWNDQKKVLSESKILEAEFDKLLDRVDKEIAA